MITRLKLTGFKKHKNTEVFFTEGMNLITGANYQGKSSLLQGVLFCLYGYGAVPGGKAVAVNDEAKHAAGELDWAMNGQKFSVVRKGINVTLIRDDIEIAKGATPVAAELEKLFGLSSAEFRQLKFSAQKETEALLTLGTTKLHAIIEDVSKATVVNKVIDMCKTVETECKGGLDVLTVGDVATLKKQVATKATELKKSHAVITDLKVVQEKLTAKLADAATVLNAALTHNTQQANVAKEIKRLNSQSSQLESDLDEVGVRAKAAKVEAAKLPAIEADLAMVRTELQAISVKNLASQDAQRQRTRQEQHVATFTARRDTAQASLDALEPASEPGDLEARRAAAQVLADEHTTLVAKLHEAKHAAEHAECPTCKRPLDDADPEALKAAYLELSQVVLEKRHAYDAFVLALRASDEARVTRVRLEGELAQHVANLAESEALLAEANKVPDGLVDDSEYQARLKQLEGEQAVAKAATITLQTSTQQVTTLTARLAVLKQEAVALPPLEPDVDAAPLEKIITGLQEDDVKLRARTATAEGAYREGYSAWQSLDLELKQAETAATKRAEIEKRLSAASQLKKFLASGRDRYLAGVWDGVMARASNFVSGCTEGYIEAIQRAENGVFSYVEQGKVRSIDAGSGAQRSMMGLGVMISLADLLPCPLDTLLLDEPSADMDPTHSLAATSILAAEGRQIIMVSHRDLDGAVAQNVVEMAA